MYVLIIIPNITNKLASSRARVAVCSYAVEYRLVTASSTPVNYVPINIIAY